eukprot:TRINITY_DN2624_c0_g1_i1.p1 TRINITY_DN2624_c0_g1~~TRINITY_DN2624_c0_g1_i1.p1  ORF type:complete len:175 (+),score=17.32 TRINITY_DN2624_c0_g1_i1:47-526(+)
MKYSIVFLALFLIQFSHGVLYIVNQLGFDQGLYRVLDGTGTLGGTASLQELDNRFGRLWDVIANEVKDSNVTANLCLDVFGFDVNEGATVGAYTCSGQNNQGWIFDAPPADSIFAAIHPIGNSELCLDVSGRGTNVGTPVILYTCNGGTNQMWARFSTG